MADGDEPPRMNAARAREQHERDLHNTLRMGGRGGDVIIPCPHNDNIMCSIEMGLEWRFNEHSLGLEGRREKGRVSRVNLDATWSKVTDGLVAAIIGAVSTHHNYTITTERAWRAISEIAEANRYDPVKEWVRSIPRWDEKDRIPELLDALKVERSPLDEAYARVWLCGAMARAMKPGTKFDFVLLLVGREGGGKSTLFSSLVPYADWFTDSMTVKDLEDPTKAGMLGAGTWIVELAELSGMRKAEAEALKAAVTRTVDRYRPPYGRAYLDTPRRWVLGGTTNSEEYLRDTGGNRRFMGMKTASHTTNRIDIPWVLENRDQLWAHARYLVNTLGPAALVLPDDMALAQQERAASAVVTTAWDEEVARWLQFLDTVGCKDGSGPVGHDAWISNGKLLEFLKVSAGDKVNDSEFYQVKAALSRAGFKPDRPRGVSREAEAYTGSDRPRILIRGDLEKARLLDIGSLPVGMEDKTTTDKKGRTVAGPAHGMRFRGGE